jgi:hypothetical protein
MVDFLTVSSSRVVNSSGRLCSVWRTDPPSGASLERQHPVKQRKADDKNSLLGRKEKLVLLICLPFIRNQFKRIILG